MAPGSREGLTLSPKALLSILGVVAGLFAGGGYVARGGKAEAAAVAAPAPVAVADEREKGALTQRVATLERDLAQDRATAREDMRELNKKLDNIASRLPAVHR